MIINANGSYTIPLKFETSSDNLFWGSGYSGKLDGGVICDPKAGKLPCLFSVVGSITTPQETSLPVMEQTIGVDCDFAGKNLFRNLQKEMDRSVFDLNQQTLAFQGTVVSVTLASICLVTALVAALIIFGKKEEE